MSVLDSMYTYVAWVEMTALYVCYKYSTDAANLRREFYSNFKRINGDIRRICGDFWAIFGRICGDFWAIFGRFLGEFRRIPGEFWAIFGDFGRICGDFGANLRGMFGEFGRISAISGRIPNGGRLKFARNRPNSPNNRPKFAPNSPKFALILWTRSLIL